MLLVYHICIASLSLFATGYTFLFPSKIKLQISYTLVALTFITGTFLVIENPAHLTQTCLTGITYLAVVTIGLIADHRKLATVKTKTQ
jgi:hypothetical protein